MMKKLEFETSKGRFVVSDERYYLKNEFGIKTAYLNGVKQFEFEKFIEFSRITEEQASEIVDEDNGYGIRIFQNYQTASMQYFDEQITAIESLHSLLKSKGIHLFKNPFYHGDLEDYAKYKDAEQKTFHNPYIFKLLQY